MLDGSSSIRGNTAGTGGGLVNLGSATLVMHDSSSIQGNTATYRGGGGVWNHAGILDGVVCDGTDANVYDNTPDNCGSES